MNSEAPMTDAERARKAASGDQTVFADIYHEFHPMVFGYLRARVLDSPTAEDLAQEVFVRAYRIMDRFHEAGRLKPWLMGIGRNVLREHLRRSTKRKEVGWTELCFELEEAFDSEGQYEDVLPHLTHCLNHLGESASQAIRQHYMAGQKVKAIAQELDRSVGAVKVLMVRARQALKKCIESQVKTAHP